MKKKISLFFGISLTIFLLNLTSSLSLTCQLKNVGVGNPCDPGDPSEICVFSMFQNTDSHAGDCSYGDWKVCCEEPGGTLTSRVTTDPCDPDLNEVGIISLLKPLDSHAEKYQNTFYPYYVCLNFSLGSLECGYKTFCAQGEGLFSIKQDTDSHVAEYNYYSNNIFCCIPPFKFKAWVEGPSLFTIGRPQLVNIYVQNLGNEADSYYISYTKEAWNGPNPADQLVEVELKSNRIHSLESGRIGNTFATITILGPITTGKVTFNISSENNPSAYITDSIDLTSGFLISLPEFGFSGMILMIILAVVVFLILKKFS